MKKLFSLTVFSFFTLFVAAQSKDEAKVMEKVAALNKAIFQTKDSAAIQNLVSNNVSYGHSTGIIEDKPAMIRNAVCNKAVYNNFTAEDMSVKISGNTAIVRHTLRASVVNEGSESPLNIGILQVWIKENGDWKLLARQAVKVNPKS